MLDTPYIDHDALRETLPSCSVTVRDEGYSPLPTRIGKMVFSSPRKGACNECFLNHSSSLQPRLSSWTENAPNNFLHPEKAFFFQFSLELESFTCSPFSGRMFSQSPPPLPTNSLIFFPSSAVLCGSKSPFRGQFNNSFRWALFPSPH
jgi:hypothetical protein